MKTSVYLLLHFVTTCWITFEAKGVQHTCSSKVYCYGPLLEVVQMSRVFNDSKTFVDMKMKSAPKKTLSNFFKFMAENKNHQNQTEVRRFVQDNFELPGQDFLWEPEDWERNPKLLDRIQNASLKQWGHYLNGLWRGLGQKIKEDVQLHQHLYSIIWVPNPVIVPGGRFREFYYWNSYSIIQGLLLSDMFSTARGVLENFLYIIYKHGHIPSGGRVYYLKRSQPPLLAPMVKLYVDAIKDDDFVENNIDILEREFDYWVQSHTKKVEVRGKLYTLAVYGDSSQGPRPEFYYEDVMHAQIFEKQQEKEAFYSEIKAAAESGSDFSRRWFNSGTKDDNLTNTKTRSIIPVELNAIMFWNAKVLQEFNEILGREDKVIYFRRKAKDWMEAVTDVLWHEDVGAWLDYDLQNSIRRDNFYLSNVAPLWAGCYPEMDNEPIVRGVLQYLERQNITSYVEGMSTSFMNTGEQWEYPNVWPTLLHMLVVGLSNTKVKEAKELARKMADSWIKTNFILFNKTIAEQFNNAELHGIHEVPLYFGLTNGINLDLLDRYKSKITLDDGETGDFSRRKYLHRAVAILGVGLLCLILAGICVLSYRKWCKRGAALHVPIN